MSLSKTQSKSIVSYFKKSTIIDIAEKDCFGCHAISNSDLYFYGDFGDNNHLIDTIRSERSPGCINQWGTFSDSDILQKKQIDKKQLAYVMKACAKNDTRYYLKGLAIYENAIAATDGHRLHFNGQPEGDCRILAREGVDLALKLAKNSLTIELYEDFYAIRCGQGNYLLGKYVDGRFPDVSRVIPKKQKEVIPAIATNKSSWTEKVQFAKEFNEKSAIHIDSDGAHIPGAPDSINDRISAPFKLPEITSFNIRYLCDAFCDAGPGDVYFNSSSESLLLETSLACAVVMPIRIQTSGA
jgi:DNA polymerase III sliding clamp (beta) subunit (PCNA family)